MGKCSYANTVTDGCKAIVDAIQQLTRALTGDLGGALSALERRQITIPIHFAKDRGGDGSDIPGYANGTNGYEYFGSGRLAMLHGWEKVTPLGKEVGSGQAPPIKVTVPVYMDGVKFLEVMATTAAQNGLVH